MTPPNRQVWPKAQSPGRTPEAPAFRQESVTDRSCESEERRIREVLNRHAALFVDFHDVKTRRHGSQIFAELHLSVDGSLSVKEAHYLTNQLEEALKKELPNLTITIHVEPK